VVDYPPLAMFLWRWSYWAVSRGGTGLDPPEVRNVAVKLPSVLGDIAAVALLIWALGSRGLGLAALYWAAPVSWLPSAALGYLDGAYAPLAAAALVAAGRGRSGWAGAWLAAACLVKPTAVVVAPAVAIALIPRGVGRAFLAGLAVAVVTLAPFAIAGTLGAAVVHVYRSCSRGRCPAASRTRGGSSDTRWPWRGRARP
jgi:Gpi18-like mannosyltransferase